MDQNIAALLNNPAALRQMLEETQQTIQQSQPTIPIPQVDVPADVILHGKLDLIVEFPWSSIANLDSEAIHQRVMDVIMGASGPWLPRVYPGNLVLVRERKTDEQREPEQPKPNLVRPDQPRFPGTIPGLRDSSDEADVGNPGLRTFERDKEPDPFSEG